MVVGCNFYENLIKKKRGEFMDLFLKFFAGPLIAAALTTFFVMLRRIRVKRKNTYKI